MLFLFCIESIKPYFASIILHLSYLFHACTKTSVSTRGCICLHGEALTHTLQSGIRLQGDSTGSSLSHGYVSFSHQKQVELLQFLSALFVPETVQPSSASTAFHTKLLDILLTKMCKEKWKRDAFIPRKNLCLNWSQKMENRSASGFSSQKENLFNLVNLFLQNCCDCTWQI